MRILLVNDDGYNAPGIQILAQKLHNLGHCITIVAPDSDRSCSGHSATFYKPFVCNKINNYEYDCFSITGTPVDCVLLGVLEIGKSIPFDLVISGVNTVSNLGTDILFSGTVQQMIEASRLGLKAIAISGQFKNPDLYNDAIDRFIEEFDYFCMLSEYSAININIPFDWKIKNKFKICPLGMNKYENRYIAENIDINVSSFTLVGKAIDCEQVYQNCDVVEYNNGYMTVSPVPVYGNDMKKIEQLKSIKK